jgi:hypothetical protein
MFGLSRREPFQLGTGLLLVERLVDVSPAQAAASFRSEWVMPNRKAFRSLRASCWAMETNLLLGAGNSRA